MRASLAIGLVASLLIASLPSSAHAEQRSVSGRLRTLPGPFLGGLHGSDHFTWLTTEELDLGVSLFELVEIEVGAFHALNISESGLGIQARAGLSPVLIDTRTEWRGWTIAPSALAGYRYVFLDNQCHEGTCRVNRVHDLSVAGGIDVGWWAAEHFGFFMRPLTEVDVVMSGNQTIDSGGPEGVVERDFDTGGPILGLSFTIGFGF